MDKVNQDNKRRSIRKHEIVIIVAIFLIGIVVGSLVFAGPPAAACNDGIDNDGDGLKDYPSDPGCSGKRDTSEKGNIVCDDGVDNNDADSLKDWPNDPGCSSLSDNIEADGQCDDTIDNDGDTKIDYPYDLGCASYSDSSEYGNVQCDDGIDNDGDGKIDYPYDTGCADSTDNSELEVTQCNDGVDNDGDTFTDYPSDPGCSGLNDSSERSAIQCDDGIDNDGDGFIDYPADSGCTGPSDNTEYIGNSCADSDGGLIIGVQGTVSGYFNQQPYSNSDYCLDSTTQVEYYCSGSLKYSSNTNCNSTGNFTTMCLNGTCV